MFLSTAAEKKKRKMCMMLHLTYRHTAKKKGAHGGEGAEMDGG